MVFVKYVNLSLYLLIVNSFTLKCLHTQLRCPQKSFLNLRLIIAFLNISDNENDVQSYFWKTAIIQFYYSILSPARALSICDISTLVLKCALNCCIYVYIKLLMYNCVVLTLFIQMFILLI